jgi:hypothetical protein
MKLKITNLAWIITDPALSFADIRTGYHRDPCTLVPLNIAFDHDASGLVHHAYKVGNRSQTGPLE